ncbi:MAG: hypothetical protein JSS07_01595 [Proteobacteria bacterium]|nr:hypothetical protein [Pseudomonadota bacterium]
MKHLYLCFAFIMMGSLFGCTDLTPGVSNAGGVVKVNYIDNYYAGDYYIAEYYIADYNRGYCSDGYCYKPRYRRSY